MLLGFPLVLRIPQEVFRMSRYYKCNNICHMCMADKETYMISPANLAAKPRLDKVMDFLSSSLKPGARCTLTHHVCYYIYNI